MFYRESGDFKKTYRDDSQTFPIKFDRRRYYVVMAIAFLVLPWFITDYIANAVMIPFLVWAIAALGLNILVGYCGQLSLGTGGFMAVGAYATYKLMTSFPGMDMFSVVLLSGFITAFVGMIFGLPSLRIKGFYLAVATLAAQFFLVWLLNKVPWFYNYSASGQITAPERSMFGIIIIGPANPLLSYLYITPEHSQVERISVPTADIHRLRGTNVPRAWCEKITPIESMIAGEEDCRGTDGLNAR